MKLFKLLDVLLPYQIIEVYYFDENVKVAYKGQARFISDYVVNSYHVVGLATYYDFDNHESVIGIEVEYVSDIHEDALQDC